MDECILIPLITLWLHEEYLYPLTPLLTVHNLHS